LFFLLPSAPSVEEKTSPLPQSERYPCIVSCLSVTSPSSNLTLPHASSSLTLPYASSSLTLAEFTDIILAKERKDPEGTG